MNREQWEKVEAISKAALDRVIDQGKLSTTIDSTALAQFFNTLIGGIAVHSKVSRSPEEISGVVKTAFILLHSGKS